LGGSHNFAADRAFASKVMSTVPDVRRIAQENRAFMRRSVRFMLASGVEQFVDLGSGIPTVGNVHEVAASVNPASRVVYIDHDPVAVAHSRAILEGNELAAIISGDLRKPGEVLANPALRRLISLERPVGVLLNAVLHFVPDDAEAAGIVAALRQAVPAGSYVAISHASSDQIFSGTVGAATKSLYSGSVSALALRSRDEIVALFGDMSFVEPGVVRVPFWRPDSADDSGPSAARYPGYAGVALVE